MSLRDLYKGKTSKMALTKDVLCKECDGRGGKEVNLQRIAAVGGNPTVCDGDNACMCDTHDRAPLILCISIL